MPSLQSAGDQVRELSNTESDFVSGGLEIPIGPLTIQLNFDSECWAVWYEKNSLEGAA